MKLKLAVFGIQPTIDRIHSLLEENKEIELLPFTYSKAEETTTLLDTVYNCDVYLFTEYLSYLYVYNRIEKERLPTIQIEPDPYMVSAALYRLQAEKNVKRIAFDLFDESYLDDVVRELNLDEEPIKPILFDSWEKPDPEQLITSYTTLWNEGNIEYVLASTEEIAAELRGRDIPASTLHLPELRLKEALNQTISLAKLSESENNQMVTGYISVKGIDEKTEIIGHSLDILKRIRRILTRFSTRTDTTFVETEERKFVLYGSEKLHKHLKEHYRSFPLLQEMKSSIKLPVHLGFGLGLSALESAKNAEIAHESCQRSEHSICYITNERQEMIGPIGVKKEIDTSSLYQALIHHARLNNELSYNFIDFITDRNNEPFSTNDVALFYQVTKRSAERTVNKLLTGNVIKIAGEERPYKKGRPRKLFTLNH
ncbi:hypothetical protein [Oceanobacillus alkalisoli]|uniref:hypothetical protein n=1 Tax=Oceanobacillus alkalisoli TaxID=2925113 RepID=UPI001EE41A17|nr:hypothetical protein [Oceanobacillus alkalisoli]MCG5102796.1 hypothetical protein [Oceanobacillus alkalisoli]